MIVDSSAWIEYLRASGSAADRMLHDHLRRKKSLLVPDLVYQEVLQGARGVAEFARLARLLDQFPPFRPVDGRALARDAALLYARCRWAGFTPRSANDCLIAMCAVEARQPLLHQDSDFDSIARMEPRLAFVA